MPLYEYRCRACQNVTEVRHGFKEPHTGTCPACGAADLARVFNPAPIVFKGSGFYVTDSRKSSRAGDAAKTDAAPKSDSATKGDAAPKADASKSESSQSEAPKAEAPKSEPSKSESASTKSESSAA